jgi:hypothetical protein
MVRDGDERGATLMIWSLLFHCPTPALALGERVAPLAPLLGVGGPCPVDSTATTTAIRDKAPDGRAVRIEGAVAELNFTTA